MASNLDRGERYDSKICCGSGFIKGATFPTFKINDVIPDMSDIIARRNVVDSEVS